MKRKLKMRKTLLCSMLLLFCNACGYYKQASTVSNQIYTGMSIQDFRNIAGNRATLESMQNGYTIYRMNDYDWWSGQIIDTRFYYFYNGKLVQMDGGVRQQDRIQIETISR